MWPRWGILEAEIWGLAENLPSGSCDHSLALRGSAQIRWSAENKTKNHPRLGHWLFPPSASPFPFPCCVVAIPAGAAVTAGLLVPWAGGCPRLAPSAPSIGVTALPGQCHVCGGAAPDGISRLLRYAPVFSKLQPLGSCGFNRCLK